MGPIDFMCDQLERDRNQDGLYLGLIFLGHILGF